MNSSGTAGRSSTAEPSRMSSCRCGNCSVEARTELARNSSRRLRSLNRLARRRSSTSNPVSLRMATSADRSAGCSYARELIPGKRTRARSGGVVMLVMLGAFWRRVSRMFEPELEAMPDSQRAGLQLERLRALVDRLLANGGVQAERLDRAGISGGPDITSLDDLSALPMTEK